VKWRLLSPVLQKLLVLFGNFKIERGGVPSFWRRAMYRLSKSDASHAMPNPPKEYRRAAQSLPQNGRFWH
jgi:hypothetical protein